MIQCKPIYEFIVWENCNNNCRFCFQRKNPKIYNKEQRELILGQVLDFIESDKFIKGSHLLVVGGEIFHLIEDKDTLEAFYDKVIEYMKNDIIDLLYINTNLIYKDLSLLITILNNIKEEDLLNRVRFTTSYDIDGRFKTEEDAHRFINNVKDIRKSYPELHMVVNTILTKKVCQLLTNTLYNISIKRLMQEFDCWVNLIPYIIYDENMAPSRNEIFEALQTVEDENEGYIKQYINNLDLDQEKKVFINKGDNFELCQSDEADCGHSINFKRYSTNGSCYICDLKRCFNGYLQE